MWNTYLISFVNLSQGVLLININNPNIVQYLDYGKSSTNNVYWYVMELLVGDPVDAILEKKGPLCEADAIKAKRRNLEIYEF